MPFSLSPLSRYYSQVDPSKLNVMASWKHNYTLETVLVELRRYVWSTLRKQPVAETCPSADSLLVLQGDGLGHEPQVAAAC